LLPPPNSGVDVVPKLPKPPVPVVELRGLAPNVDPKLPNPEKGNVPYKHYATISRLIKI